MDMNIWIYLRRDKKFSILLTEIQAMDEYIEVRVYCTIYVLYICVL